MSRTRGRVLFAMLVALTAMLMLTPPAYAAPPAQGPIVHIVAPGETLTSIAERYGLSAASLAKANDLSNRDWIYAGQRLRIPGQTAPAQAQAPLPAPAPASGGVHVVGYGESLTAIAARYGTTVEAIVRANEMVNPNFVYAGQHLTIPAGSDSPSATASAASTEEAYHVVGVGETLSSIAARYGVSLADIKLANNISNTDFIYVGQRLRIPGGGTAGTAGVSAAEAPVLATAPYSGRWIDVNLSTQTLTAYEGTQPVFSALISSGLPGTPTVTGHYRIYVKYDAVDMSGPGYYLPAVPWTMFFYRGYAIHGAYWHNNFGTPMSHGCVNLSVPDAKWVYDFASVETPVVVHY